ncbi:hypothetical protein AWRIB429_2101 [Oenococcus oeni AWRIB429]|uniref:Uncharacterized protein n=2 Tax=Lactobacillaceae TaxID=33958 RepID=A0AAC9B460_9LACO|nr:Hypothetical protein ADU70_0117 [Pediococcus damnosus]EFD87359.1 hypothetical protein AWRIB429_2101 [Oenococcus oeni AWRIB429]
MQVVGVGKRRQGKETEGHDQQAGALAELPNRMQRQGNKAVQHQDTQQVHRKIGA